MKTFIASLVLGCAFLTQAADPPQVPEPVKLCEHSKLDFDLYGTASYRGLGKGPARAGAGAGLTYWLTQGLGVGVRAEGDSFGHSAVDRSGVRLVTRGNLWNLKPYGFADIYYNFETQGELQHRWIAGAGGGVALPFHKQAAVFAEAGIYTTSSGAATSRVSGGLRFSLF